MQKRDFENITLRNSPKKHIIVVVFRIWNGIGLNWKCPVASFVIQISFLSMKPFY